MSHFLRHDKAPLETQKTLFLALHVNCSIWWHTPELCWHFTGILTSRSLQNHTFLTHLCVHWISKTSHGQHVVFCMLSLKSVSQTCSSYEFRKMQIKLLCRSRRQQRLKSETCQTGSPVGDGDMLFVPPGPRPPVWTYAAGWTLRGRHACERTKAEKSWPAVSQLRDAASLVSLLESAFHQVWSCQMNLNAVISAHSDESFYCRILAVQPLGDKKKKEKKPRLKYIRAMCCVATSSLAWLMIWHSWYKPTPSKCGWLFFYFAVDHITSGLSLKSCGWFSEHSWHVFGSFESEQCGECWRLIITHFRASVSHQDSGCLSQNCVLPGSWEREL